MFKFLSSDFVSEYNRILDEFIERQRVIDDEFSERIDAVVTGEISRLEDTVPVPFRAGEEVVDTSGLKGIVISCPVSLEVREDESYHGPKCGPAKYLRIMDDQDEEVLTCEGLVRKVLVSAKPSELEKDWGQFDKVIEYWSDELKKT